MRDIKFRSWDKLTNKMVGDGFHLFGEFMMFHLMEIYIIEHPVEHKPNSGLEYELWRYENLEVMQFTGHQVNGKDLYESDIVRIEENADGVDPDDKITYYVVVWLQEWSMFALLRVADEYPDYLANGADGLDADMFWTFPLEPSDTETSKHYLCGNIWENPELLHPIK